MNILFRWVRRFEKCVFEGFKRSVRRGGDNKHLTYIDSHAGVYTGPFVPLVSGFCTSKSSARFDESLTGH